ncbi:MAG: 23S rRNA (pseudouridine(1915)-N(3))-methyltransferase RlmH [Patescibacteria group bacterium]|nr:23S rRNA (pseudouridine(1915)-N(3))-methyltransferase RlmH [Patescibacteria group bacterium]MDE1945680.1 23S rRNA (pseudouridine(1915)-N(3))-methyltransferase RlmH [Patescibacteria group bacterium]
MKFLFISVGKNDDANIADAIAEYTARISRHLKTEWKIIPSSDKETEAERILKSLKPEDFLVALDEKGKEMSTRELSQFLEKRMITGGGTVAFAIGGAYGLDDSILKRANLVWSLSKLTLPHQLARLLLAESVYRAMSVIKHEPYHHA